MCVCVCVRVCVCVCVCSSAWLTVGPAPLGLLLDMFMRAGRKSIKKLCLGSRKLLQFLDVGKRLMGLHGFRDNKR